MRTVKMSVEETQALLSGRVVELLEDVTIELADCLEARRTMDVVARYDNEEYWLPEKEYGDDFEPYQPFTDQTKRRGEDI